MPAYLDHAATAPVRPEVLEAMLPYLTDHFGNASGSHAWSRRARQAVDEARDQVAACLGCRPGEVVFTGGGTEADNLAILGVHARTGGRVLCSAIEHHAVLHAVEAVGGATVPVTADGIVDLDVLRRTLKATPDVRVVSVMLANNEIGTVQPVAEVAALVRRLAPDAVVHTDAVQAALWLDVAELAADADLIAIAAHKLGGPKGVGCLVVHDGVPIAPTVHGGGQERGRRSGTLDVAGIVGFATALQLATEERKALVDRIAPLRNRLADHLLALGAVETGDRQRKVAGNCHVRFPGVESEALLFLLDELGVAGSAGSACASGALEPSHVLLAMGIPADEALSSLRLSLGWTTTEADVACAIDAVTAAVGRLR